MDPIFIILYAVVVTLALTLLAPRLRRADPRWLWALLVAGVLVFLAVLALVFLV